MHPFRLPGILIFCIALFAGYSCSHQGKEDAGYTGFSPVVDSSLRDTVQQSLYVDSMRREVLFAKNDTDRVRWLNELAAIWRGSSGRAMADEAKRISSTNGDKYGIADSEMRIAQCLIRENKYKLADSVIRIAEQLATEGKYNYLLSRLYIMQGDVHRFQGDNAAAVPFIKKGIALAAERNYRDIQAYGYSSLGDVYQMTHRYDSARFCLNRVVEIAKATNDKSRLSMAYGVISVICRFESKMDSALFFVKQSLMLGKQLRDKNRVTSAYSTIGEMYRMQNDDAHALVYYDSARVLASEIGNKNQLAYSLGSMGSIYRMQNQPDRALHYYLVALSICREVNNKTLIATNLSTIGDVYRRLHKTDSALMYLREALEITKSTQDGNRQGFIYVAIGDIFLDAAMYDSSLFYLFKADSIAQVTPYENLKAITWNGMARTYTQMGNLSQAERYGKQAMIAAEASKMPTNIQDVSEVMYKLYNLKGDKGNALDMYVRYIDARDSVENEEQIRKFARVEYEAKESELKADNAESIAIVKAQEAIKEKELKNNRFILMIVGVAFVLLGILAFFIFRSLQATRKARAIIELQKSEVERQKNLVDEKNKSIHDSITYARRLQDAIIPDEETIHESFEKMFILYLPKDIVAGDFYWYERTSTHIFFAAADCTGHGVPGALVSVVCSNALNRAVNEYGLSDPGKILDKSKELILDTFRKSHQLVHDGMDISLLAVACKKGEIVDLEKAEVKWAGAHNPLWILRDGNIIATSPDKQPVGKWEIEKPFTTHILSLQKGDQVFLITDGFADQFGGAKGKKMKYRKLQEMLIAGCGMSAQSQCDALRSAFYEWMGDLEQVDDVTIISVRV